MLKFQPALLASITQGSWHGETPDRIEGFCFDTRRIKAGFCFVALQSGSRDGHDFVVDAIASGASSAITSRILDCGLPQLVVADPLCAMAAIAADRRSKFTNPVIGITGSCGKTSTKEMLRLLLGGENIHATSGNWNNRIGVPMTLFDLEPDHHAFAVIEAGINQPGEMAHLGAMIEGDLTILTNIGPAHLELLGSLSGIAEEKSKLAEFAKADSPLILPAAALQYPAFAEMAKRCIAVTFGEEPVPPELGQVVDCQVEISASGETAVFTISGEPYEVKSASLGIARNAALAVVAARTLGVPADALAERLGKWTPESTRGRIVADGNAYYYIDCYNANPASMIDAVHAFEKSAPAAMPRCYVIGAMNELGSAAEEFHRSVGGQLNLRAEDRVIFVGPVDLTAAYRSAVSSGQVKCLQNTEEAQSIVADFRGALFLKGSRSYQLESLLPASLSI